MSVVKKMAAVSTAAPAFPFGITVAHSARRRTTSIEIRDAQVTVRAPVGMDEHYILAFVTKKQRWIEQKIAEQQQRIDAVPERQYVQGATFPYLGTSLQLHIETASEARVQRVDTSFAEQLVVALSRRSRLPGHEQVRRLVSRWYQQEALTLLTLRTEQLAAVLGLQVASVSVKATRSRWGQCTTRGDIQYNWQIILAPDAIVDYLVAHEVCHLRHHNHGPAFWALVEQVCPHWRQSRQWLKNHGMQLVL